MLDKLSQNSFIMIASTCKYCNQLMCCFILASFGREASSLCTVSGSAEQHEYYSLFSIFWGHLPVFLVYSRTSRSESIQLIMFHIIIDREGLYIIIR